MGTHQKMRKVTVLIFAFALLALAAQSEASKCQAELRGLQTMYARNARGWNREAALLKRMLSLTNKLEGVKDLENDLDANAEGPVEMSLAENLDTKETRRSAHSSAVKRLIHRLIRKIENSKTSLARSISRKARQCQRECLLSTRRARNTVRHLQRSAAIASARLKAWRMRSDRASRKYKNAVAKYMTARKQSARDYRVQKMELAIIKRLMFWTSRGKTADIQNKATEALQNIKESSVAHRDEWNQISELVIGKSKEWTGINRILHSLRDRIRHEMLNSRRHVRRWQRYAIRSRRYRRRCMLSTRIAYMRVRHCRKSISRAHSVWRNVRKSCRAQVHRHVRTRSRRHVPISGGRRVCRKLRRKVRRCRRHNKKVRKCRHRRSCRRAFRKVRRCKKRLHCRRYRKTLRRCWNQRVCRTRHRNVRRCRRHRRCHRRRRCHNIVRGADMGAGCLGVPRNSRLWRRRRCRDARICRMENHCHHHHRCRNHRQAYRHCGRERRCRVRHRHFRRCGHRNHCHVHRNAYQKCVRRKHCRWHHSSVKRCNKKWRTISRCRGGRRVCRKLRRKVRRCRRHNKKVQKCRHRRSCRRAFRKVRRCKK